MTTMCLVANYCSHPAIPGGTVAVLTQTWHMLRNIFYTWRKRDNPLILSLLFLSFTKVEITWRRHNSQLMLSYPVISIKSMLASLDEIIATDTKPKFMRQTSISHVWLHVQSHCNIFIKQWISTNLVFVTKTQEDVSQYMYYILLAFWKFTV